MDLQTRPQHLPMVRWLPSALLVGAVVLFALLVSSFRVITWTGPGFSMFSAADYRASRFIHVHLETSTGELPAVLPLSISDLHGKLIEVPSESNAAALGDALLELTWRVEDNRLVADPDGSVLASNARVELWTATIQDNHLVPEQLLTTDRQPS